MDTLFRQILDAPSCALTYLLADLAARNAVVVDPLRGQAPLVLAVLAEHGLRLRYVLRTHVHRPDRLDCGRLCPQTGACFVIGAATGADLQGQRVAEGDTLEFGRQSIRVIDTPGHVPGSVSYLWQDRLFCGDVLHISGCDRSSEEADPGTLFDSVTQKLFRLPDETLVFPGHDFAGRTVSTIAEERALNAAFAGISREAFVTRFQARSPGVHEADHLSRRRLSLADGTW